MLLAWPPDVFGIAAYLLHKTGGYRYAICNSWWKQGRKKHADDMKRLGEAWRGAVLKSKQPPAEIGAAWQNFLKVLKAPVMDIDIPGHQNSLKALLDLLAMADAACAGFGVPHGSEREHEASLLKQVEELLNVPFIERGASTLARHLDPQMLCVLPKIRTPQTGLTIRSLSHHLAIWPRDEVCPLWAMLDTPQKDWECARFNLLLLPWPYRVDASQFSDSEEDRCGRHFMHSDFGCFDYSPADAGEWIKTQLPKLLAEAVKQTSDKQIHGVILPELCFKTKQELAEAYWQVNKICPTAFMLAGVAEGKTSPEGSPSNCACFVAPEAGRAVLYMQGKHHRWQLESNQIQRYRLTEKLQTGKRWWESSFIEPREQHFLALKKWLTFSFLICEDLARQEPAARLVRAVGPNLIIALLLDGQQTGERWPGRYASVLAEDPGSSVLTLTSLGMVIQGKEEPEREKIQKHRDFTAKALKDHRKPPKRWPCCNIGLWRDKDGHTVPLSMDPSEQGLVLSLTRETFTEFSADGRSEDANALVIKNKDKDILPIRLA